MRSEATRILRAVDAEIGAVEEATPARLSAASFEHRQWFTEAALLWPFFGASGGEVLVNTLGSTSLGRFRADLDATPANRDLVRRALTRAFGWTQEELTQLEAKIARLTSVLALKYAITAHIAQQIDASGRDTGIVQLVRNLYGPLPFHAGDVDLVVTSTAIFVCLDYDGETLLRPDFDQRPAEERQAIGAFLQRVDRDLLRFRAIRFPAFGAFDPTLVDASYLRTLTAAVGDRAGIEDLTDRAVLATLSTMVSAIPKKEAELYLVHDVWGHGWQESLCEFETVYRDIQAVSSPVLPAGGFYAEGDHTFLDDEGFLREVEPELRRRITIALNVLVAECLADLVEHKMSRQGDPLRSTSLLEKRPLRADLSLFDARRLVRMWRKPYAKLVDDPNTRACWHQELRRRGHPEPGLVQAMDRAARLLAERFACAFDDRTVFEDTGSDSLRVSLLSRIGLAILTLDAKLVHLFAEMDALRAREPSRLAQLDPLASVDLLALTIAWFYEQDRKFQLWHLDELVGKELLDSLHALARALEVETKTSA